MASEDALCVTGAEPKAVEEGANGIGGTVERRLPESAGQAAKERMGEMRFIANEGTDASPNFYPESGEQNMPTTEDLRWVLDRTTAYIRDIDTKNGIILAVLAIVAAVLFSKDWLCGFLTKATESGNLIQIGLLVLTAISFAWCLASLFASLIPRVRSREGESSLIYSAGIVRGFTSPKGLFAAAAG